MNGNNAAEFDLSTTDLPGAPTRSPGVKPRSQFVLVANSFSGSANTVQLQDILRKQPKISIAEAFILNENTQPVATFNKAFQKAQAAGHSVLVVGGDGSINLATQMALIYSVPIAVIPLGTFNLFARHHQIPLAPEQAVNELPDYHLNAIPIATVNKVPINISANFGGYAKIFENREKHQSMVESRGKLVAFISGIVTFIQLSKSRRLTLDIDGKIMKTRSNLFVVTKNREYLKCLGIEQSPSDDLVDETMLIVANPKTLKAKLKLLFSAALGNALKSEDLRVMPFSQLRIHTRKRKIKVAVDGELHKVPNPAHVKFEKTYLQVYLPEKLRAHDSA